METLDILSVPRPVSGPAKIPATDLVPAATTTVAPSPMTIKQAAIAYIQAREPEVLALVAKYQGVALDLSTPKALAAGRAQRTEVREKGRLQIQRDRDGLKDVLNAAKKDAEAEADRLIALVKPVEDHLQAQIDAREKVLADEKAERERIAAEKAAAEAARVKRIKDEIDVIRGMLDKAKHGTSVQIDKALQALRGLQFTTEQYAEFAAEAQAVRDATVTGLEVLCQAALAREAEAARVEQQRIENERRAAELAEQQRQLDEQAAALKQQQAEAAAARLAAEEAAKPPPAPAQAPAPAAEPEPVAVPTSTPPAAEIPHQTIGRSTRKAITEPGIPPLNAATPAELRNEWALFYEALQRVDPVIRKHGASVDTTRYIRALDRIQTLFA